MIALKPKNILIMAIILNLSGSAINAFGNPYQKRYVIADNKCRLTLQIV